MAWAALSAHLIDMGGMAMGSFAPAATDCYQEALRIPPVRILRQGVEVSDVWDIFRINVRLDVLVEMDLRGLVAGGNVAHDKVVALASTLGVEPFERGMRALQVLSEVELRRRIRRLAPGSYRATGWVEWDEELFRIPCTLTIDGRPPGVRLHRRGRPGAPFLQLEAVHHQERVPHAGGLAAGARPALHRGAAGAHLAPLPGRLGGQLRPPAPINAGHIHVAFTAAEIMMQCLRLAVWASPDAERAFPVTGLGGTSALALTTWSGIGLDGTPDTWMLMDGAWSGGTAGHDRDGDDMGGSPVGPQTPAQVPDVEILESWYPMLLTERRVRPGLNGAGRHRSGGGNVVTLRPHGTDRLVGQMLGMRAYVPLEGAAGGLPGDTVELLLHRRDGRTERVSTAGAGVVVDAGEAFEIRCASGGGVGDPLRRTPGAVATDVATARLTVRQAADGYGVVLDGGGAVDDRATARRRASMLRSRLRRAAPALRPLEATGAGDRAAVGGGPGASEPDLPLYPGVVQRGDLAVAVDSGAPLAVAPDHWTDGCPVLETRRRGGGPPISTRAYLDPRTGQVLHVEVVPEGTPRSFEVRPGRWA